MIDAHLHFISLLLVNAGFEPASFQVNTWSSVVTSSRGRSTIEVDEIETRSIHLTVQDTTKGATRPEVAYNFWLIVPISRLGYQGKSAKDLGDFMAKIRTRLEKEVIRTEEHWAKLGRDALTERKTVVTETPEVVEGAPLVVNTGISGEALEAAVVKCLKENPSRHHAGWVNFEQFMALLRQTLPNADPMQVKILACKIGDTRAVELNLSETKLCTIRLAKPEKPYPESIGARERLAVEAVWPLLSDKPRFISEDDVVMPEGLDRDSFLAYLNNVSRRKSIIRKEKEGRYNLWAKGNPVCIIYHISHQVGEYTLLNLDNPAAAVTVKLEDDITRPIPATPEIVEAEAPVPADMATIDEVTVEQTQRTLQCSVSEASALLQQRMVALVQLQEEHAAHAARSQRKCELADAIGIAEASLSGMETNPLLSDVADLLRDQIGTLRAEHDELEQRLRPARREALETALNAAGNEIASFTAALDRILQGMESTEG